MYVQQNFIHYNYLLFFGKMSMESFEKYYNQYYRTVFLYINKKICDEFTAEDITMDCFMAAYQNFDRFEESKASFGTWLFVIVNNKLKNYYRDKKIHEEIDENSSIADDFSDDVLAAEYISEMRDSLYDALMELNELQRKMVIYKYFYEKNSTEISEITGVPAGSVRVQLSRAIAKLKKYFDKKGIEWEE